MNGTPRNLLSVDMDAVRKFIDSVDTVLSDCDGVVHIGLKPIKKSKEALEKLKAIGKNVHFISNNCTHSVVGFTKILQNFGLDVKADDVVIPTRVIVEYLKGINFQKTIYVIGLKNMIVELQNAGFKIADNGPSEVEENMEQVADQLKDNSDVGAVVVDVDVNLTYLRLQKACIYLQRNDVLFIVAGSDNKVPFYNNIALIGPAYFHNILKDMTGREPMSFGKPSLKMNEYVNLKYKLDPKKTLFIGDSFSDVEFSRNGGYKMLMVLTGNVKENDINNSGNQLLLPDYYLEELGNICEILDKLEFN